MTADQSKATREEYIAYLHGIVRQFELPIHTYERVTRLTSDEGDGFAFQVLTHRAGQQRRYRAKRVILAMGDMHFPRPLSVPGMGPVEGRDLPHVTSFFEEPHPYVNQRLLIVGGRNSAVEAAIRCYRAGARVSLSYRGEEFASKSVKYWLKPEIEWLIKHGDIQFYPRTVPLRITPTNVTLGEWIDGQLPSEEQHQFDVPTDFVLLQIGFDMDSSLLQSAGVKLSGPNRAPELDPDTMETNIDGLYVAGTAAAGTQIRYRLFIENCHSHVVRILRAIAQQDPRHINPLGFERLNEDPLVVES
jgi:thioredoxin reductase (NADPH)